MTPALQQARQRRLATLVAFLVIGALAIAFLLSPWGRSRTARQVERDELFRKVKAEEAEVAPLRDIDKKIVTARGQIAAFEKERLPAEYSSISEALGKLALQRRVQISGIQYQPAKEATQGLLRLQINASVAAPYPDVMRFINDMERSKMFFIIDGVSLEEQVGGQVRLQITFETYLRGAA